MFSFREQFFVATICFLLMVFGEGTPESVNQRQNDRFPMDSEYTRVPVAQRQNSRYGEASQTEEERDQIRTMGVSVAGGLNGYSEMNVLKGPRNPRDLAFVNTLDKQELENINDI